MYKVHNHTERPLIISSFDPRKQKRKKLSKIIIAPGGNPLTELEYKKCQTCSEFNLAVKKKTFTVEELQESNVDTDKLQPVQELNAVPVASSIPTSKVEQIIQQKTIKVDERIQT